MNKFFFPDTAPFSYEQQSWLAGFAAGLQAQQAMQQGSAAGAQANAPDLHILFGTQTGNSEAVAEDAAEMARATGFTPHVTAMDDVSMEALAAMEQAIVVVSTYGEGEMPDNAELFWDALSASTAPRLETLNFGVLALGDTGYDDFCQAGKLIDTRFEQLGAKRMLARMDCDVDYEDAANGWLEEVLPVMAEDVDMGAAAGAVSTNTATAPKKLEKWGRKNPYISSIIENRLLSSKASAKEIRHFSLELADDGIGYEAGDALGVVPVNDEKLVDAFLTYFGAGSEDEAPGFLEPLKTVLKTKLEIVTPNREFIRELEARAGNDELSNVVANGDKEALEAFLWNQDTLDLLNLANGKPFTIDEFLKLLKPLQHRAYSISSSPKAHDNEVHLTVAAVRWDHLSRQHNGVCSTFLADTTGAGTSVPVFVSPNKAFRVPTDDEAPMIMVGPGTGIAPFRAFLEERRERAASGRNWLFFGDQHRAHDFIYEEEIGAMSKQGVLDRLDLAFSRDQKDKVYVQSRMLENGKELFAWLEEGGYFYVCGDATRMAKDVDSTLHQVISENGSMSTEAAADYVSRLKREKRYLRDVY
ncbi:MAG: sulfite reductase flavoprotein subunit alpha [Pseudomonadota bacterium]